MQVSHKDLSEELSPLEEHAHSPIMPRDSMYDSESGQASVYLYKRDKESAAEILQPLISQDPRHFRSAQPQAPSTCCPSPPRIESLIFIADIYTSCVTT